MVTIVSAPPLTGLHQHQTLSGGYCPPRGYCHLYQEPACSLAVNDTQGMGGRHGKCQPCSYLGAGPMAVSSD
jgi:hypothetical protein